MEASVTPSSGISVGFLLSLSVYFIQEALSSCVPLGKLLKPFESQFPYLQNGSSNIYLEEFLLRISGMIYAKDLNLVPGT